MKKTMKTKVLSATMVVGLLSLTACSGENYDTFCEVAANAEAHGEKLDELQFGDDVINAALEGDLAPLNAWGEEASVELKAISDEFASARDNAPDEEAEAALTELITGVDVVERMTSAAADAAELEEFITAVGELESEFLEFEASSTDTTATLDAKTAEYCA